MNMKENDDARLAKAAMKSLIVPAPESLKAGLKRLARRPEPEASLWDGLRQALSGGAWAYGAGAAFAAAAVGVIVLRAIPVRETAVKSAPRVEAAAPQALAELWSDDDGGDDDEI